MYYTFQVCFFLIYFSKKLRQIPTEFAIQILQAKIILACISTSFNPIFPGGGRKCPR